MDVETVAGWYRAYEAGGGMTLLDVVTKHGNYLQYHDDEIKGLENKIKKAYADREIYGYNEDCLDDVDDYYDDPEGLGCLNNRLYLKETRRKDFYKEYDEKYLEHHVIKILQPQFMLLDCPDMIVLCYGQQRKRLLKRYKQLEEKYQAQIDMNKERMVFYETRMELCRTQLSTCDAAMSELSDKRKLLE